MELTIWAVAGLMFFVVGGVIAAEMDSAFAAVATFVIGLVTLKYGFGIPIFASFAANPFLIIAAIMSYIAAGALFTGVWRWPEFIRENDESILKDYTEWSKDVDDSKDNSFEAFLDSPSYMYNAWQHKERLGTWVGMWPFSLGWELARKPAIWIWNTSYHSLGDVFQRIGKRAARKIHNKG